MRRHKHWLAAAAALLVSGAAMAQTPAPAPSAPPNPGAWQLGGTPTIPLHFMGPVLTGRPASGLPIDTLKVPRGFKIEVWTDNVPNARELTLSPKGTLFVGNLQGKSVYAVIDRDGKREVKQVLKGLDVPNGVVFSNGTLFVAERTKISRYDGIEDNLDNPPAPKVMGRAAWRTSRSITGIS